MRVLRRLGGITAAGLCIGMAAAGPVTAQTTDGGVYSGNATAQALQVSILGQGATLGSASSAVDSSPSGTADASAALLPGIGVQGESKVSLGEPAAQNCVGAVPAPLASLVGLNLGCSSASASLQNGAPVATSTGTVAGVTLDAQTLLNNSPIGQLTQPVTSGLNTLLGTVCTNLQVICPVTNTVQQLVQSVVQTRALDIKVGDASTTVTGAATSVVSQATANAATVEILPDAVLNGVSLGAPFATIQVGKASATVACDYATGSAVYKPSVDPALVTIKLAAPIFSALPPTVFDQLQIAKIAFDATSATITLGPGQSLILPGTEGTPLQTEISVAGGSTKTNADGSTTAAADGVKLGLLEGINGGLLVDLAHAEATGGCAPAASAVAAPAEPAAPQPVAELPRTGGTAPWIPITAMAGLGLALVSRRALLRAR